MRLKTIIIMIKSIYTYFFLSSSMSWISPNQKYQAPKNPFCFVKRILWKREAKVSSPSFWNRRFFWYKHTLPKCNGVGGMSASSLTCSWLEGDLWERMRLISPWVPEELGYKCFLECAVEPWPQYLYSLAWQLFLAENQSGSLTRLGCKIFNLNILQRRVLSYSEIERWVLDIYF